MIDIKPTKSLLSYPTALAINILLAYILMMICRIVFVWLNIDYFTDLTSSRFFEMAQGGLLFDTSAICYANSLYVLLYLLPLHFKERKAWHNALRKLFVAVNMAMAAINFIDSVYFPFSGRRTTMSVFSQFSNENNLAGIFFIELARHWYLVLLFIALTFVLYKIYRKPRFESITTNLPAYYATMTVLLGITVPFAVFGMRGGIGRDVRPITISNANQYVDRPAETAIVLNTPFSLMRTIGKKTFVNPKYFSDTDKMEQIYSPVHTPADSTTFKPRNVVVLVLESFGKEYIGALNRDKKGYKSYTPFLDSLIEHSLTFKYSFANGQQSIDGLPSVLSGIPRFVEPFFLTPASLNKLSGLGSTLKEKGYYTAFFHGARRGSMGFQAYSRSVGYTDYFGREDYNNDDAFDGNWAIWDEEFLQYFADKTSTFSQPFSVGIFTASSHHPYNIPERYNNCFTEGTLPIHRCVTYSDNALRLYFNKAKQSDWYANTLFVLTADHTNLSERPEYLTDAGRYAVPIIFYTPDGSLQGYKDIIAQQIDIMPTVLGFLGYDAPHVSFGCNLLDTPAEKTFAVNYNNGIYQYFKGDYMLQFDGEKAIALYDFKNDNLLRQNLKGKIPAQKEMELELKAIIQQYMWRMNEDRLTTK